MVATQCTPVFNLDAWMKQKATGSVMIEHVGDISSEYIDSVLPAVEQNIYTHIEQDNVRKRAFHIFIECIQNLYHHIESTPSLVKTYADDKLGAIVMTMDGGLCRVTTGNFVSKTKMQSLCQRIDALNAMDADEIKRVYRETINNRDFSDKGGAGIGMIDMRRKTGNKLQYAFYKVKDNPELMFFSFDVCIS
ncbi:MAG: SiaB family protein kinase [Bacteroidia bacterium]|nr:SiaB family protein kinase [Bacteroidia bacterium]